MGALSTTIGLCVANWQESEDYLNEEVGGVIADYLLGMGMDVDLLGIDLSAMGLIDTIPGFSSFLAVAALILLLLSFILTDVNWKIPVPK